MATTTIADARMAAWRRLLETHAALTDRLGRELELAHRLPLAWYDVLVQLSEAPAHRLRMQQLVAHLLLSKSGITRLVDRMVEAGLIERQSCAEDRRGAFAAITPRGVRALREAAPEHLRGIDEHFARHLDDADVAALNRALQKILDVERPRCAVADDPCGSAPAATLAGPASA